VTKVVRAWPLLAQWAPPLVLGGFSLVEIWGWRILQTGSFYGPAVVHTMGALVMVVGLSVRVRAPGLCLAAVLADGVLEWAYARGASQAGGQIGISAEWFIAMLIAFYFGWRTSPTEAGHGSLGGGLGGAPGAEGRRRGYQP